MSGKQNGKRRVFGVKQTPLDEVPKRFTRPEGSHKPIERVQSAGAAQTGHTMAPKRWAERNGEL